MSHSSGSSKRSHQLTTDNSNAAAARAAQVSIRHHSARGASGREIEQARSEAEHEWDAHSTPRCCWLLQKPARTRSIQSPRSDAAAAAGFSSSAAAASSSPSAVDPKRRRVDQSPLRSSFSNSLSSSNMQRDAGSSAQMPMQIEDDGEEHKSAVGGSAAASSSAAAAAPAPAPRARARSPPPKKKVSIKPFKVAPRPPDAYAAESLSNLSSAVAAVYAQSHSAFSQEELYRAVEALCNLHKAPEIYSRLYAQCNEHVGALMHSLAKQVAREDEEHSAMAITSPTHAAPAVAASATDSSPFPSSASASASSSHLLSLPLLQSLQTVWSAHCQEMIIIRGIFLFLDRTYVMKQAEMASNGGNGNGNGSAAAGSLNNNAPPAKGPPSSLWEMGLTLFCEHLLRHPRVASKTIGGLLCLVEKERLGESINRPLLKSLLRMLSALKLYASEFQPLFLDASAKFYRAESCKSIASEGETSVVEYIHSISSRFAQEEERCIAYLDEATRGPLMGVLEQELIAAHASHLLGPAFSALVDSKRIAELGVVYKLFARIHALELMRAAFETYVKRTSESIVKSGSVSNEEAKPAATDAASSSTAAAAAPTAGLGSSTPATMVIDLLRLKLTLDEILSFSFHSDVDFIKSLKLAFEAALNCVDNVPAELIAKFMDRVLRTGGKGIKITAYATSGSAALQHESGAGGMDDVATAAAVGSASASALPAASAASSVGSDEVETLLDQLMFLFRYLHSKDIFQAWYKKDLAKRLLLAKSASVDSEKSMISKIKNECGASFTTKLEGMFKDMELSKDIQREYEAQCKVQKSAAGGAAGATSMDVDADNGGAAAAAAAASSSSSSSDGGGMELSVQVLTTGSWPAYTALDCTLPPEVARLHEDFKLFYLNKHSGRKLVWHHSLGTATLRAHFPRGRKELAVSAIQAVVLMQFNDHIRLSLDEIGRYAGITDAMELKRTLASLTFTDDLRILLKEPRNKKLLPTDVFSVNAEFAYKLFRIKINSVQLKETKEEHKATSARVLEDRQYALDACIVRVMKARKTLHHQQLVGEVLAQSKFPAKPADIKRRIASLIEREYMARDENDSNMYNYMA